MEAKILRLNQGLVPAALTCSPQPLPDSLELLINALTTPLRRHGTLRQKAEGFDSVA